MTDGRLSRATTFPEPALPDFDGLIAEGRKLAARTRNSGVDFIAPSTFNGVALGYLKALKREMADAGGEVPPAWLSP